jgi:phosphate transport system substrate-binding protein
LDVKLKRQGAALGVVAVGAILLSSCGTDPNGGQSAGGASGAQCGGKQNLVAEGSSAQQTAITDAFLPAYEQSCNGQSLAYTASGSGAGVKQFVAGQTDFSGSDSALDAKEGETAEAAKRCKGNPAWNLPMVFGPVGIAYNLKGVDLTVTPDLAAQIFSGKIKKWNDPKLAAVNKGQKLPNQKISVFYRSDESGTTDNFQKYLGAAAKNTWKAGDGKMFKGGAGEGKNKSDGVASATAALPGSITYVEWSYAQSKKLQTAKLDSGAGPVALNADSAKKAIENPPIEGKGNDLRLNLDQLYASKKPGAYPLMLATYEIVCSKGYPADTKTAVKAFLKTAATTGQSALPQVGYVPLPESFKQKIVKAIDSIS